MASQNAYRQAIQRAKDELGEINKKLEDHQALLRRKATLESYIQLGEQLASEASSPLPEIDFTKSPVMILAPRRVPLWQVIMEAVSGERMPISAKEALDVMQQKGHPVNGAHKVENVRAAMTNKPEVFEKTTTGKFILRKSKTLQRQEADKSLVLLETSPSVRH
jgi:hypothetical protein